MLVLLFVEMHCIVYDCTRLLIFFTKNYAKTQSYRSSFHTFYIKKCYQSKKCSWEAWKFIVGSYVEYWTIAKCFVLSEHVWTQRNIFFVY